MRSATFLLALVALLPADVYAQSTGKREEVLNAVRAFGDALEAGDAEMLTAAIWTSEGSIADARGRDAFVRLVVAEKRLERAAAARFGAAGGSRLRCNFSLIHTPEERAALSTAEIFHDTDTPGGAPDMETPRGARVQKAGETYPIRLRRGPAAEGAPWRVVVDVIETLQDDIALAPTKADEGSQLQIERYDAMATAIAEVAAGVEKAEYASAQAAEAELVTRLERVLADYIAKRSALPGRRGGRWWYR